MHAQPAPEQDLTSTADFTRQLLGVLDTGNPAFNIVMTDWMMDVRMRRRMRRQNRNRGRRNFQLFGSVIAQRKPMWVVALSSVCGDRAAGR